MPTTWTKKSDATNEWTRTTASVVFCSTEGYWFIRWYVTPWFYGLAGDWNLPGEATTTWTAVASATVPTWTKASTATNTWS